MVALISSTECDDSQRHKKKYVKASTAADFTTRVDSRTVFLPFHDNEDDLQRLLTLWMESARP